MTMASARTIQRFSSHSEQKAEIYRYWRSRPIAERFMAVWDASATAYALKGITIILLEDRKQLLRAFNEHGVD
jgi:hypothetical protein